MSHRLIRILLVVCSVSLFFASCSKKISSDEVLPDSYGPSIIIGSNNGLLYALDPSTGAKNWELSLPSAIVASPLIYNNMVYVGITNGPSTFGIWDTLYKINAKTGKMVKKFTMPFNHNFNIVSTPIADGKNIYLATTNDSLYAIDTGTGATVWSFGETIPGSFIASPTIANGNLYIASMSGSVYGLNKATGATVWQFNAPVGGTFASSPSVGDSFLFVGCSDSNVYCLYLTTGPGYTMGTQKWAFKTHGAVTSSPAAYFGNCVFGSKDFNVYCVDVISGLQKWVHPTGTSIDISSALIKYQVAYIGSNDYNFYALDMIDGHEKWKFITNGIIASSPVSYNGLVYIGSSDNTIYAIDSATGTQKWNKYIGGQIQCSPAINDFSNHQYNSQISGYTN